MSDFAKALAVVQHDSAEYLGLIEDHFEGRRIRFRYFRPFTSGGRLPQAREWAGGLVLLGGGPLGAAPGPSQLPGFDAEVALTATALASGVPTLGIGLGALILCRAAGGGVSAAPLAFNVSTAMRTVDDALAGYLPCSYPLVRYGRDAPLLPPAARVLAIDEAGQPALFQIGERAFGFLGHPGIKSAIIEDLIMEFTEAPADPEPRLHALRDRRGAIEAALVPIMTGLVRCMRLMDEPRGGAPPA